MHHEDLPSQTVAFKPKIGIRDHSNALETVADMLPTLEVYGCVLPLRAIGAHRNRCWQSLL